MRTRLLVWTALGCLALALSAGAQESSISGPPETSQTAESADTPERAQFDFANGLFVRGMYAESADEYHNYLKAYPQGAYVPAALYRLGEAEYAANHDDVALDAFNQFLQKQPEPKLKERATLRKGEILYRLKKLDEAAPLLEALTTPETSAEVRAEALYQIGKLRYDQGKHSEAQAALKRVIDELGTTPQAPYARYQLGFVYLAQSQGQNAALEFAAVASTPSVPEALRTESRFRAAEAYDAIGWFEQAAAAYDTLRTESTDPQYADRAAFGYAWALFHAHKYPEAAAAAADFLSKYPGSKQVPGVQYLQANCLQEQKQYDQSIVLYRAVVDKYPGTEFAGRSQYKTAWVFHLQGKPDEARAEVTKFLETNKESPLAGDASFLLGILMGEKTEYENAYQQFRTVYEKYPQSEFVADALYKAGECLAQLGRTPEAATAFEAFAQKYPDNPLAGQAILRVGDASFFAASFAQAVTKYQSLLSGKPDPAVEQDALYRLAVTYYNMQKYQESADTFRTLIEKYPTNPHVSEAHLRRGDYLLREGKDAMKAIEAYQASLDAAPTGPLAGQALKGLALARYETKDVDGAADLFYKVIVEYPDVTLNETTYAWVGQRFFDQQKWDQATKMLDALLKAVPAYPNPERIRFKIAECSEKAGRADEAIGLYQAIVDAAPQNASAVEARFRMADLYEKQKKMDKALVLYEEAANTNTGDTAARARFHLGELAEARKEYEPAAKHFMRVAILFLHEQLSPEALWRAGQCYEKANRPDQAKKAYQELLAEYPKSPQAAQAQQSLGAMP